MQELSTYARRLMDWTTGPLDGVRVVELASIGPIPFCGMVLSDMGADVVRIDKLADVRDGRSISCAGHRARSRPAVDRRRPQVGSAGVEVVLRLVEVVPTC